MNSLEDEIGGLVNVNTPQEGYMKLIHIILDPLYGDKKVTGLLNMVKLMEDTRIEQNQKPLYIQIDKLKQEDNLKIKARLKDIHKTISGKITKYPNFYENAIYTICTSLKLTGEQLEEEKTNNLIEELMEIQDTKEGYMKLIHIILDPLYSDKEVTVLLDMKKLMNERTIDQNQQPLYIHIDQLDPHKTPEIKERSRKIYEIISTQDHQYKSFYEQAILTIGMNLKKAA